MTEREENELFREILKRLDEEAKANGQPTMAELIDEAYELFGEPLTMEELKA